MKLSLRLLFVWLALAGAASAAQAEVPREVLGSWTPPALEAEESLPSGPATHQSPLRSLETAPPPASRGLSRVVVPERPERSERLSSEVVRLDLVGHPALWSARGPPVLR